MTSDEKQMANDNLFLNLPERGKTEWWRYLFGFSLVFLFWFFLGAVPAIFLDVFAIRDGNPDTTVDLTTGTVLGIDPIINFVALNLSFVAMLMALFFVIWVVHKRPFRTLITPFKSVRWRRLGQGFGFYLLLIFMATMVEYIFNPDIYQLTLNPSRFALFTLFIFLFTPLQTFAEELFFRGYLMQSMGHWTRNFWVLSMVNGILYMLPHLTNPEVKSSPILLAIFFVSIGAFFAFITLRDNGLELAMGAHAANNMFTAVFANYTDSVLKTEPIFTVTELNPLFSLFSFFIIAALFYLVLLQKEQPDPIDQQEA